MNSKLGLTLLRIIAETIREAKEIPSGHLYAHLMDKIDLETYNSMIQTLKNTGLVKEEFHVLKWVEPKE